MTAIDFMVRNERILSRYLATKIADNREDIHVIRVSKFFTDQS